MTFDLPSVQTNVRAFISAVREQAAASSAAEQSNSSSSRARKREFRSKVGKKMYVLTMQHRESSLLGLKVPKDQV
jgi:hypothetical protein